MSSNSVIWKYQLIILTRNKFLLVGLFFLIVAGLYGARYGRHFVQQQNKVIYSVDTLQQRQVERSIEQLKTFDTSRRMNFPGSEYYRTGAAGSKTVVYRPSPFATLSIGQKDNYPYYHQVTGSDFYSVTSTDIQNPVKLLAGNFDLAFVIIYLFPLFIIALGYNALSGEKESSTFTLLRVQGSIKKLLRVKLAFQATLLIALSLLINLCSFWMNSISFVENGAQMGAWITISIAYILFWFSIVYFIASLNQPSATNALALGGIWIILLLLLPSVVHRNVSSSHEKELVQSMFNSRGDFDKARDLSMQALRDSFAKLNHEYPLPPMQDTGTTAEFFYNNLMSGEIDTRNNNARGRSVVNVQANEYNRAMKLNWINPVFAVQNAFNQVAETEINNYHNYLFNAEKYQTKRRYFLYGYSMRKMPFGLEDYQRMPEFDYKQPVIDVAKALALVLPVLVLSILLILFASFRRVDR